MRTWPLLAAAALVAAPALAQEAGPPPPPLPIPVEDLIAPPEITAEEEAVIEVDPSRRHRSQAEIAESKRDLEEVIASARAEAGKRLETAVVQRRAAAAGISRHARAWAANADHLSFLSDYQKAVVGQLAYAGAAVNLCEDLRFAPEQVEAGFAELSAAGPNARSHERRLLVAYGVAVGLMMADHEPNVPAFCEEAKASTALPEAYLTVAAR